MGEPLIQYLIDCVRRLENRCCVIDDRIGLLEVDVRGSREDIIRVQEEIRSFHHVVLDLMDGSEQENILEENRRTNAPLESDSTNNGTQNPPLVRVNNVLQLDKSDNASLGRCSSINLNEKIIEDSPGKVGYTNYDKRETVEVKISSPSINIQSKSSRLTSGKHSIATEEKEGVRIGSNCNGISSCKLKRNSSEGGGGLIKYDHKSKQPRKPPSVKLIRKEQDHGSSKKAKFVNEEGHGKILICFSSIGIFDVGPFKLCKAIHDPIEAAVVDYIFDRKLDPEELIAITEHNHLQRGMFSCLEPNQYLFGEVINVMSELLTEFEKNTFNNKQINWFLTTRMTSCSMGKVTNTIDHMRINKYRRSLIMGDFSECKNIFIPIHHSEHWFLLIFRVELQVVEIWDSLIDLLKLSRPGLVFDVMRNLDKTLEEEIGKHRPLGWSFTKFNVVLNEKAPQQDSSSECGIFVINFMQQKNLSALDPKNYKAADQRVKVILKLAMSNCNLNVTKLKNSASEHYTKKVLGGTIPNAWVSS